MLDSSHTVLDSTHTVLDSSHTSARTSAHTSPHTVLDPTERIHKLHLYHDCVLHSHEYSAYLEPTQTWLLGSG